MKIVVLVKQVPEVTNVQVDPVTGTLIREGVKSILNPFCEYALDHAVRLKHLHPEIEVIAITMGPAQARDTLLRCLELGVDRAILVSGREFAGADTWATALTLAAAVKLAVPDFSLIFTGKQAIDGDTAQVGPEIAEILSLPQVTYGVEAVLMPDMRHIHVKCEIEQGYEVVEAGLPALITFSKGEVLRRVPSMKDLIESRIKPIELIGPNDLPIPAEELGLSGSFTQVVKVFPPVERKSGELLTNIDAEAAAKRIFDFLKERRFL